ncbi:MAG TPA: hypothetical protein ENK15_08230, partial [Thermopetrobacter sp.]|nr:hypothetical protein [Thermopetrobacter sp.]
MNLLDSSPGAEEQRDAAQGQRLSGSTGMREMMAQMTGSRGLARLMLALLIATAAPVRAAGAGTVKVDAARLIYDDRTQTAIAVGDVKITVDGHVLYAD